MKKLLSLAVLAVPFALIGCNPDHSGDVQAPQAISGAPSAPKDPAIPAGVKSSLPPAGPPTSK